MQKRNKNFYSFIRIFGHLFGLIAVLFFSSLFMSCKYDDTFVYDCSLPTEYEAKLTYSVSPTVKKYYHVICREEYVNSVKMKVEYIATRFWFKDEYTGDETEDEFEYLRIADIGTNEWTYYIFNEEDDQWIGYSEQSFNYTNGDFYDSALYCNNVWLRNSDLIKETEEQLEYRWGGGDPDFLIISNNDYHICIYHKYASPEEYYTEMTEFMFDESLSPIPHIDRVVDESI